MPGLGQTRDTGAVPDALTQGFVNPPIDTRPLAWWHWMDGNIPREGIDQDIAPGHNGLSSSPGGDTWIVYHANPGANTQWTAACAPRTQRVDGSSDGRPVFNPPETAGMPTPAPAN